MSNFISKIPVLGWLAIFAVVVLLVSWWNNRSSSNASIVTPTNVNSSSGGKMSIGDIIDKMKN